MIIAVNNNKGGVLKTTTVTNLAGVLSQENKRVLIVDADNQSNVSLSFGLNPDKFRTTLYDVLVGGVPPEDAIINLHKNIDLLPSNLDLINFEFDVIGDRKHYTEPYELMKNALHHLQFKYDYILIDTPPSLSLMNSNVFTFADKVLIPTEPESYALRSVMAVIDTIKMFKGVYNPALDIAGILFTKVVHNSNLHDGTKQEIKKFGDKTNVKIFETEVPRTVQYANSVGFDRLPATLVSKKSDKSQLYFAVWKELNQAINFRKETK